MSKPKLEKVTSRIECILFSEDKIHFLLHDYPLELWLGPCSEEVYLEIYNKANEFSYWDWNYCEDTHQIYNIKSSKWKYVLL